MKHVPNILTITRFLLIPFILYFLITQNYIVAIVFLAISGATDVLDGTIARKYNYITDFGKLMDPLADKTTQVATLLALVMKSIIRPWILAIVVVKEFIMVAGASFLYGKELVVYSRWYGKLSTVLFYIAIFSSMLIKQFNLQYSFDIYLYYLAIIATLFSLGAYFKSFWVNGLFKKEKK